MNSQIPEEELNRIAAREALVLGEYPRISPLEFNELSSELLDIIVIMEAVNSTLESDANGDRDGTKQLRQQLVTNPEAAAKSAEVLADLDRLPEIVRTMLRHGELFKAHAGVGLQLHSDGALSQRERELAILRIAWLCQTPYAWGEHVMVGKQFGLTGEDIQHVINGPSAEVLAPCENAILQAVDELFGNAMISDSTWTILAEHMNEQQLIELPIVIGHYQSIAFLQNSLRLRLQVGNKGLKTR